MSMGLAARLSLIRADRLVAAPWKNGGGVTREIAAEPPGASLDAFAWRVSVADVAQPGPFSRFPGVDRTLVLLSGAGMTLVDGNGARQVLAAPLERLAFAGETPLSAELADGPTRDFNLMTRRAVMGGRVSVLGEGGAIASDAPTLLLFCACGAPSVALDGAGAVTLGALDTLRVDAHAGAGVGGRITGTVRGEGALLCIELTPRAAAAAA
ncbi:HutD family protein [Burkholderia glumae]|uniref:HutD/Ves family protein n=1 Tax=Burkholderia glumae TaxID=337 RepID=UPI000F601DC2|nr:HutD family protein [Burkholderia glumae]MCQ0033734.1 HutD family protein [Burkholderia glumae]MCQ0038286.1 HutD family protein [Burkholderia glumae]QJW80289.1 HutD family protein [Burkholderia glumae]RQZ74477.1 HutD family protein [Burkholderia glumae]UVS86614.1 HutD family protein [Burkholderia glumae]